MKKILLVFLLTFFCIFPVSALEISTGTSSETSGIFSILEKINKEKTALSELEGQIDFEEKKIEQNGIIIDSINTANEDIKNLENQIIELETTLTQDEQTNLPIQQNIADIQVTLDKKIGEFLPLIGWEKVETQVINYELYKSQKKKIDNLLANTLKDLSQGVIEGQKFLVEANAEAKNIQDTINKSQITLQIQIQDVITKIVLFVTTFVVLYFGSRFLQSSIRSKSNFSDEKKEVLSSVVKWTKNILLFSVIIFFFFSEFLTILPFLAILGTALGFALRDVISSFIAWFIIGLKDGIYSVGDVIEMETENVFGRVVKITPLITVIQELGLSGPNGMYRSFPNKKIFESSIKNIWKQKGWIFISTDFLLEAKSDVILAKKLLLDSMNAVAMQDKFTQATSHKTFLKKFGHTDENLRPQVFLEIRPQGVLLRGKVPVMWGERHMMRTEIVERFVEKIRKTRGVDFRFVEIGGGFMNGKN